MKLIDHVKQGTRRKVFLWMGAIGLQQLTGYRMYEVYGSPERQLELARKRDSHFPMDFIYPLDDGAMFKETFGTPMLKPDFDFPSALDHIVTDMAALKSLRVLDPDHDGRMPANLATYRLLAAHFEKPLAVSLEGPFTLASELVGVGGFMRAVIRNPAFVDAVMRLTTETVARYAMAAEANGVRLIIISEPAAVNIASRYFAEIVQPALKQIYAPLTRSWKMLHICGDTSHLLTHMMDCGAEGLSLETEINFPKLAAAAPEDMVLMGNISCMAFNDASPEELEGITRQLLDDMQPYANFIGSSACDLYATTPWENISAVINCVRTSPQSDT